jgi:heme O synthase-like polyprenyltransferase
MESGITSKRQVTGLSQTDKKWISVVVNSVPIGYIVCVVLGIGSWKQLFIYLLALCLVWLIGTMMSVKTYYKIAQKSFLVSVVYIIALAVVRLITVI